MGALRTLIETRLGRDQNRTSEVGQKKVPADVRPKITEDAQRKATTSPALTALSAPAPAQAPAPVLAPASNQIDLSACTGADGEEPARVAVAVSAQHSNGDLMGQLSSRESMASRIAQDRLKKRGAASPKPACRAPSSRAPTARAGARPQQSSRAI